MAALSNYFTLLCGFLTITVLLPTTYSSTEPEERIVGGVSTQFVPSVGAILLQAVKTNNSRFYYVRCSCAVVGPTTLITAASCVRGIFFTAVDGILVDTENKNVMIGLGMKSTSVEDVEAEDTVVIKITSDDVIYQPQFIYNSNIRRYDVALIKLSEPLNTTRFPPFLVSNGRDNDTSHKAPQYMTSWGQPQCDGFVDVQESCVRAVNLNCSMGLAATDQFCSDLRVIDDMTQKGFSTYGDGGAPIYTEQPSGPNGTMQCVIRGVLARQPNQRTDGIGCSSSSVVVATSLAQSVNMRFLMNASSELMYTKFYNCMN